ncbi:2-hydroxyacid dehydrogenase [Succinatimonas hippei]|uniref:2-hydroxyacid dehydrogenase n=1 Tax=Succinatimonas hippei TaxID=626938 RepID=UPI00201100EA|nr:2-hydroxyacid dehydrogenase [Succinatimonas hippei]MCL1603600.1 2-hydroxyacid dehydrogenase [Succinatimonas hippei]
MRALIVKQAYIPVLLEDLINKKYAMVDLASSHGITDDSEILDSAEILITNGEAIVGRDLIDRYKNLKLIANFGVGYDGIDASYAASKGIFVTNTPGVLTDDVADLGVGLLLALSRNIVKADHFVKDGSWQTQGMGTFPWTKKVSGSKVGIVGMGRIGSAIAKRLSAFDVTIGYCNQKPVNSADYKYFSSLIDLAEFCDFLIVCVPGVKANNHLIDEKVLKALGPQGYLINISRGSVVDEQYLTKALSNEEIKGAALDVFEHEPHVSEILRSLENVILTPHMASATHETRKAMGQLVFDNIEAFLQGKELITPVPECNKLK